MSKNPFLQIEDTRVGKDYPVYFIADIAANHDGDLERAKDLIFLAAEAGADAAKFQHFNAKTIVSDKGFKDLGTQSSHQAKWQKSVFDVYQDATVNLDWTETLKACCKEAGITFFTSPYSFDLVDYIDPYVPAYKIGSGDITWIEMIEYIASKQKPYIIATGASNLKDVERAVSAGLAVNKSLGLMQCNTNYTASLENFKYIQLNVLKEYEALYPNLVLGLSDHTPGHTTVLGAVAFGARMIEKHFTDDTTRIGPDHAFSMDPQSWKEMVNATRELENAMGTGIKKIEENELETVVLQRRSIRLKHDITANTTLQKEDLEVLRPCPKDAIPPYEIEQVIGKSVCKNLIKGEHLKWSDLI
ncbi:N-acetylneuraminate synthase family protein [Thiomicrorhabdus sp.]|uniref:N-acetylneuraminate synthase family protein n=1 Tax=Thiomicrorhabdus sp. TaxID=2039724 RepID=UPI002AA6CDEA|nr:N-acetylneuraminate synthase family protein [Thiomicrorhabdus sp.]